METVCQGETATECTQDGRGVTGEGGEIYNFSFVCCESKICL